MTEKLVSACARVRGSTIALLALLPTAPAVADARVPQPIFADFAASAEFDVVWQARVAAPGGSFRLYVERSDGGLELVREVPARSGLRAYRVSDLHAGRAYQVYELRVVSHRGDERTVGILEVLGGHGMDPVSPGTELPRPSAVPPSTGSAPATAGVPAEGRLSAGAAFVRPPPTPPPRAV